MEYPCNGCRRVAAPEKCENKNCGVWQKWYVRRWEVTRSFFLYGTPLHPERISKPDPCHSCLCPKELCMEPCGRKLAWQEGVLK